MNIEKHFLICNVKIILIWDSITLEFDGRAFHSLGRSKKAGEFRLLHRLSDNHSARSLGCTNIINTTSGVNTSISHGAFLDHKVATTRGILADQNTFTHLKK